MLVGELIARLQELPSDSVVWCEGGDYWYEAGSVDVAPDFDGRTGIRINPVNDGTLISR